MFDSFIEDSTLESCTYLVRPPFTCPNSHRIIKPPTLCKSQVTPVRLLNVGSQDV